jgi:hypothetical protein
MMIKLLRNGNMLVPRRAEGDNGLVGVGFVEVPPGSAEYEEYMQHCQRAGIPVPTEDDDADPRAKRRRPGG